MPTEGLSVVPFLLLPGFHLKNNDSENEISSGSSKLVSPVSILEGIPGQDDEEAQGLACSSNPHSATFLGVIIGLQPRTSLRSSKYGKGILSFPLLLL